MPCTLIVAMADGHPVLMLGDKPAAEVVLPCHRASIIMKRVQLPEGVVAIFHRLAIRQGFETQASHRVTLVAGDIRFTVVLIAVFTLFNELTIQVIGVSGFYAIKADFFIQ